MRWKINQSELCVHSALSGETKGNGGLTRSPATTLISDHLRYSKLGGKLHLASVPCQTHTHLKSPHEYFVFIYILAAIWGPQIILFKGIFHSGTAE